MGPYDRVTRQGYRLNRRTAAALAWVEERAGVPLLLAQGSYNGGKNAVSASGGTHDGGGVVDLRVRQYTDAQRQKVVRALKDAGFAAWFRPEVPGLWGPHVHAVLIGDREMSSAAAAQVRSYLDGRDGLRGNRVDRTYRPVPQPRWHFGRRRPV